MSKPVVIFRTKSNILIARDLHKVILSDDVIQDPEFIEAKMNDLLGFKIIPGSDYTAVEVTAIKDNPEAFMELAFGSVQNDATGV